MCNLYSDLTAPDWTKVQVEMLRDMDVNRLINEGAIYFERAGR